MLALKTASVGAADSNWASCKSLPLDREKSSFSGKSIDGIECNGSLCAGSVYVSVWSTLPAERWIDMVSLMGC